MIEYAVSAIRQLLKNQAALYGDAALANRIRCTRKSLTAVMYGVQPPTQRMLAYLGMERVLIYRSKK